MVRVTAHSMDQTHSGMVVVAHLPVTAALHLEHHGSTVTSLNLRRELLRQECAVIRNILTKLLYWNKYNCIFSSDCLSIKHNSIIFGHYCGCIHVAVV